MNIFELPPYYEDNNLLAWRNSYLHRKFSYPYIQYVIRTAEGEFVFEAKKSTDLLKFAKALSHYKRFTFEGLADEVAFYGNDSLLYGAHVREEPKGATVVLEPVADRNLSFIFIVEGEELMLSAPPGAKVGRFFGLLKFLHRVWGLKNEEG